jgi:hypothetical protein
MLSGRQSMTNLLLSVLCVICIWGFISVIARLDHLDQAMGNALSITMTTIRLLQV